MKMLVSASVETSVNVLVGTPVSTSCWILVRGLAQELVWDSFWNFVRFQVRVSVQDSVWTLVQSFTKGQL